MAEKIPVPGESDQEQYEFFKEDEIVDPDRDVRKVLEDIKESEERTRKEKRKRRGRKTGI